MPEAENHADDRNAGSHRNADSIGNGDSLRKDDSHRNATAGVRYMGGHTIVGHGRRAAVLPNSGYRIPTSESGYVITSW